MTELKWLQVFLAVLDEKLEMMKHITHIQNLKFHILKTLFLIHKVEKRTT